MTCKTFLWIISVAVTAAAVTLIINHHIGQEPHHKRRDILRCYAWISNIGVVVQHQIRTASGPVHPADVVHAVAQQGASQQSPLPENVIVFVNPSTHAWIDQQSGQQVMICRIKLLNTEQTMDVALLSDGSIHELALASAHDWMVANNTLDLETLSVPITSSEPSTPPGGADDGGRPPAKRK